VDLLLPDWHYQRPRGSATVEESSLKMEFARDLAKKDGLYLRSVEITGGHERSSVRKSLDICITIAGVDQNSLLSQTDVQT
jgi:hypothetical protein